MKKNQFLPRILIIDDLFGRILPDRVNDNRATLCGQYLLEDVTGDEVYNTSPQKIKYPIAQAVFYRGQRPLNANLGDNVENDLEGTLAFIKKGWDNCAGNGQCWSLILLDLCFYTGKVTSYSHQRTPGMPEGCDEDDNPNSYFGYKILKALQNEIPDIPVVIFSSKPKDEKVIRHYNIWGAKAFLPRESDNGPELLKELLNRHGLLLDQTNIIIGRSRNLLMALRTARNLANNNQNVLIVGERGTGKELLARYIYHQKSADLKGSFITVDSGSLSPTLYASELFGHKKGAFTGATDEKTGKIVQAKNGILFLDEIGNMPVDVQGGLLRVIEYKQVEPVGGLKSVPVELRFLSATNEQIDKIAATGSGFREDLLDRLREGGTLFLPPLHERKDDIAILVRAFLKEIQHNHSKPIDRRVSPEAMDMLVNYHWPGNIRQLRNCISESINQHPDNELLAPFHFNIYSKESKSFPDDLINNVHPKGLSKSKDQITKLDTLLNEIIEFSFNADKSKDLIGRLSDINKAHSILLVNYLKYALKIHNKPTLDEPEGKILIHPTVKYITGEKISASKAADIIKNILSVSPENLESLVSDPVLRSAYEIALKLRPKQQKKKHRQ